MVKLEKDKKEVLFLFVFLVYLNRATHIHLPSCYIPVTVPVLASESIYEAVNIDTYQYMYNWQNGTVWDGVRSAAMQRKHEKTFSYS